MDNTKKTTTRILKEILKFKEKVSGNTTNQQAFDFLMNEWNLEVGIENKNEITYGFIYKDDQLAHTFEWSKSKAYSEKERDWNWDFIYRSFLEHIIKTKLYKRPKISKRELNAQKKAEELKAKEEAKLAAKKAKEEAKLLKESKSKRKRNVNA